MRARARARARVCVCVCVLARARVSVLAREPKNLGDPPRRHERPAARLRKHLHTTRVQRQALAAHRHERQLFEGAELPEGRRRPFAYLDALLVAVRADLESLPGHKRRQHEQAGRRVGNGAPGYAGESSRRTEQRREDPSEQTKLRHPIWARPTEIHLTS